jgi:hypothetical protein
MTRSNLRRLLLSLVVLVALIGGAGIGMAYQARAVGTAPKADSHHAQDIVDVYLQRFNAGMSSGTCDFSALSSVFTADATVIAAGGPFAPGGPFGPGGSLAEQRFTSTSGILAFYAKLCGIVSHKGVAQWAQDAGYLLSPNVLNSYEHVEIGGHVIGHCMHVFTISGDHIARLDWSVYA